MTGEVLSLEVLDTFVHLARLHGVDTTLETLQRRYAFHEEGLEASALVALAADLMLDVRWATVKWSQLAKLKNVLPAMLMLRDGSAIILELLTDEHGAGLIAHVSDIQASGAATAAIDAGQMATIWDGRILLCKASTAAAAADKRFDLRWLVTQVMREGPILRDIAISSIFTTLFALGPPFLVMIIIDRVLINHSSATLAAISIIILSLVFFETILYYFKHLFMEIVGTRIDGRLELFVMERLLRLPMTYFETTPVGFTASRIAQIYKIRSFLTGPLLNTMLDSIALVLLVPVLFILNWRLAFFVVALALMILGIILVFIPEMHRRHSMVIATDRLKMTYLIETIQGMRAVKSLALEGRRRRGWDERVANSVTAAYAFGTLSNYPQTLSIPFQRMMYSGSLLVGAAMALSSTNTTDAGSLIAFAMIAGRTGSPLVELAHLIEKYYEVRASVSEVGLVVNVPPEDARGQNGLRLPIRGDITFDKVRFRYAPGRPLALDDASFDDQRRHDLRDHGPQRLGQDHRHPPAAGPEQDLRGLDQDRRHGPARDRPAPSAHQHRRGAAGELPVHRHRAREHRHGQGERHLRPDRPRRPARRRGGVHRAHAARLRHAASGGRHQPLGRPAPAPGAGPRPAHRPSGADPRRGHQRAGRRERGDHQRQSGAHRPATARSSASRTAWRCWCPPTPSW